MIAVAAGLREALGRVDFAGHGGGDLLGLEPGDPLGTALRLFVRGETVPRRDAAALLDLDDAASAGLVELDGDAVVPRLALTAWNGLLLAHDFEHGPIRPDHVVGVHRATETLAALTVRRPVARALDLGTAGGSQALAVARHADHVVATDVNPRALELAALNARINDVDNVELREGSLFEPVQGERFDLVVANPPFVVSPDAELVFRDAGLARDDLSRAVVAWLPRQLADGGFASALVCWIHEPDEAWDAPLRRWLEGSGCDAWLIRYVTDDAVAYAAKWASPDAAERWLDHYRANGIELLTTGAVVLRRRVTGTPWIATADAATGPAGAGGAQLERMFAGVDLLESGTDLLGERLALVPHRLNERLAWTGDGYAAESLALELDDTVGIEPRIEPGVLRTLFALDGTRTLGELPDAQSSLPAIRTLVELGFVTVARSREVGDRGFEPRTSALSERRSNQLS